MSRGSGRRLSLPKFLAIDFFCGAGGTTRGLIDAGGYVIAGVDKDGRCAKTYSENNVNSSLDYSAVGFLQYDIFPKADEYPAGQQEELFDKLASLIAYYRKKAPGVPLFFAICAPCQPFTTLSRKEMSGKRIERRERDMSLLAEASKFVKRFQPEMVLSENVSGIRDPRYGGVWDQFRELLEEQNYVTGSKVVCTSQFGIPQFRRRSILAAARREIVKSEHLADLMGSELLLPEADPDAMIVSVAKAIGHLPPIASGEVHPKIPNHRARSLSELNLKRIASSIPGESNAYMANTSFGDLTLDCHRKVNEKIGARCFGDVYTRMQPNRPSPTITTKCHSISNGRFGHYDLQQNRGISLREAAILQSFPDDYVFYPLEQIEPVARMIGNAVPPKLAQFYAGYLSGAINREMAT